jgi:hypothetical protein
MQLPSAALTPLGAGHGGTPDIAFAALLALAGLGSAVVLGLGLAALVRRRSRSYLLVTLALATLLARTGVAALSLTGMVAQGSHHLLEHGLDAAMAALVVAAVYDARVVRGTAGRSDDSGTLRSDGGLRERGGRTGRGDREGGDDR